VLIAAWAPEHVLIATTMLITGVIRGAKWDSIFPGRRDVFWCWRLYRSVRARFSPPKLLHSPPLSCGDRYIQCSPGLAFTFGAHSTRLEPPDMLFSFLRALFVYWITMAMAGMFVLSFVMLLQGTAALLPRALSLRLSSVLPDRRFLPVRRYVLSPSPH